MVGSDPAVWQSAGTMMPVALQCVNVSLEVGGVGVYWKADINIDIKELKSLYLNCILTRA